MKTIKTFLFALICFLPQIISSQVNPNVNFYPIQIGNVWQYKVHTEGNFLDGDTTYYIKRTVVSDSIMQNGKKYYKVIPMQPDPPYSNSNFIRIDSVTANVYYYNKFSNFEGIIDTLAAQPGDRYSVFFNAGEPRWFHQFSVICQKIDTVDVFNTLTTVKKFSIPIVDRYSWYNYAIGIGKVYKRVDIVWIIGYKLIYELVYPKINGKEYGTSVSVKEEEKTPSAFSLSQNYPNPFNPISKIRYSIPKTCFVSLKVYDILGREIQSLVSEEKLPGSYEVLFDGGTLATGVYFYTLTAGIFSKTKKLLLIK